MNQDEFVIFAELNRDKFDSILKSLQKHFSDIQFGRQGDDWIWIQFGRQGDDWIWIQFGRQGDDWIWIHFSGEKIEIDSFYSMNLELKGKRKQYAIAKEILSKIEKDCLLQVFDPPKEDLTK